MQNRMVDAVVLPGLGGKLISLRDRRTEREWLWLNPHQPLRPTGGETDYVGRNDFGGWDEILPTVGACRVEGSPWGESQLTDHGELWRWPWRVDGPRESGLTIALDCESLPFRMRRIFRLEDECLAISYAIENLADSDLPFLWAMHPLLAIEPGMRIELPLGGKAICYGHIGLEPAQSKKGFRWPELPLASGEICDLRRVPSSEAGYALKAFVPSRTGVRLSAPDAGIRIVCDRTKWIGLWMNYGGWSGGGMPPYFNLGVEPTTHPCDTLSEAIGMDSGDPLAPGETRRWSVVVTLDDGSSGVGQTLGREW